MSITKGLFYFGRRGAMQPLLSVEKHSNPDATPQVFGALFRGINGHLTRDIYGVKRGWTFQWTWTYEGDHSYVEAAYRGHLDGPFFLMDTRTSNLLPADVSTGGSETRDIRSFAANNGVLVWYNHTTALPLSDLATTVSGSIEWDTSGSGGRLQTTAEVPYVSGSSYLFSCYVYPDVSHTITPTFAMVDATGAIAGYSSASGIAVTGGVWQRISCAVPAASLGGVAFSPGLNWAFSDHVKTTGWQVGYDTSLAPWRLGTGSVEVVVKGFTRLYPHPRHEYVSAELWEV